MTDNKTNKDFNLKICSLFPKATSQNLMGVIIDNEVYNALQKVELGGKFYVEFAKVRKTEESPIAYLKYISKEKMDELRAKYNTPGL